MDLEWTPPSHDGGSPIEKYIVERRDPHTKEWVPVAESTVPKASVKVKEGSECQFRVRAVNKAGPGAPSDPSEAKIAKSRYCKIILKT